MWPHWIQAIQVSICNGICPHRRLKIVEENALTELEELMNQVFTRKAKPFRVSSLVFLVDQISQESPPATCRLMNSARAYPMHDLLDMLLANKVAIPRVVWFLRVSGINETIIPVGSGINLEAGLRNKPQFLPDIQAMNAVLPS